MKSTKYLEILFYFLFSFIILKTKTSCKTKNKSKKLNSNTKFNEDLIGNITIKDGNYFLKNYKILSTNKNNLKLNKKNKICAIEKLEDFYSNCKPFVKLIYDKWVYYFLKNTDGAYFKYNCG